MSTSALPPGRTPGGDPRYTHRDWLAGQILAQLAGHAFDEEDVTRLALLYRRTPQDHDVASAMRRRALNAAQASYYLADAFEVTRALQAVAPALQAEADGQADDDDQVDLADPAGEGGGA